MRKKQFFNAFATCILVAIASVLFSSCKEEEEFKIEYPDHISYDPYEIENEEGHFRYDEENGEWYFVFDNLDIYLRSTDCVAGSVSVIDNMPEQYKTIKNNVKITGTLQFLYKKQYKSYGDLPGSSEWRYKLKITELENVSQNSGTRASDFGAYKCATIDSDPPTWLLGRAATQAPKYSKADFRVFVHIVRSSAGVGLSSSIANTIISNLNSYYDGTSITFSLLGTDYIDNDRYNATSDEDLKPSYNLFNVNSKSDALNLYIISNGDKMVKCSGLSQSIPGIAAIINGNFYSFVTVAHEVGHCLGLYHTHKGTNPEEKGTPELVNGSNSTNAGDFISDTPADPGLWNGSKYAGGDLRDANGDKYNPDPYNIMSYSSVFDKDRFTTKQMQRMFQSIEHTPKLSNACTLGGNPLLGPNYIEDKAEFSMETSPSCQVFWNTQIETFTSKSTSTITKLPNSYSKAYSLTIPNPEAVSERLTVMVTQRNQYGAEFTCSKTVYHVKPSAKTGTLTWGSSSNNDPGKTGTLDLEKGAAYNRIQVYQGGSISFIYKDVCGVESYNDSYFSFNLYDRRFTRGQASHIFLCDRSTSVGSYNTQLALYVGSTMKVIPVIIEVLQAPNTPLIQQDEDDEQMEDNETDK